MKIACVSDLHGKHKQWYKRLSTSDQEAFDSVDTIVVSGDVTNIGEINRAKEFLKWLEKRPVKNKVIIAGNHDFCFDTNYHAYTDTGRSRHIDKEIHNSDKDIEELISNYPSITYLNDSGCEIDGVKFWGSPVTAWFHDWAFNRERGEDIKPTWDKIPDNTDVLITHGPPKSILSNVFSYADNRVEDVGDDELLKACYRVEPKYHIFGHTHEMYGVKEVDGMTFINASSLDDMYNPINPPICIEV
jgi:Icc-related predicted phosphoesterase